MLIVTKIAEERKTYEVVMTKVSANDGVPFPCFVSCFIVTRFSQACPACLRLPNLKPPETRLLYSSSATVFSSSSSHTPTSERKARHLVFNLLLFAGLSRIVLSCRSVSSRLLSLLFCLLDIFLFRLLLRTLPRLSQRLCESYGVRAMRWWLLLSLALVT